MMGILERLFRLRWPASDLNHDALGELLRGSNYGEALPEALLQIM